MEVMDEADRVLAKGGCGGRGRDRAAGGLVGGTCRGCGGYGGGGRDRDRPRPVDGGAGRAGYTVHPVDSLQASGTGTARGVRRRRRRLRSCWRQRQLHQLSPAAGRPRRLRRRVVARTHKTLIWERTRAVQRLRRQLREYFPAARGLRGPRRPRHSRTAGQDTDRAAKLTRAQIAAALKRAAAAASQEKPMRMLAALRGERLGLPAPLTEAYAATAATLIAVITTLNEQVRILEEQVRERLARHPDAEIYRSQPGLAAIPRRPGTGEFGDDPGRYATRNPQELRRHEPDRPRIRKEEGRHRPDHPQRPVHRRAHGLGFLRAERLARRRAYYDQLRTKGIERDDTLRRVADRLVGILRGYLKTAPSTMRPPPRDTGKISVNIASRTDI